MKRNALGANFAGDFRWARPGLANFVEVYADGAKNYNFYGVGNDTPSAEDEEFFEADQQIFYAFPSLAYENKRRTYWLALGPEVKYARNQAAEDTLVATLRFKNRAMATLEAATSVYPGYPRRIEITGTNGTLIVEGDQLVEAGLKPGSTNVAGTIPAASPPTESQASPVVSDVSAHRRIIEDFVEAMRTGREPACSGAEGRRSVAVVEAIYEAARTGRSVQVK